VAAATQGDDKAFLILLCSGSSNPRIYTQNAVQATSAAGVKLLTLNTSGQTLTQETGLTMLEHRIHLKVMLRASGIQSILLRLTAYVGNLLRPWVLPRLQAEGISAYPVEDARAVSWIAAQDLGRFAVAALDRPGLARQVFDLGGPQALTGAGLVQAFPCVLGRNIRYSGTRPVLQRRSELWCAT